MRLTMAIYTGNRAVGGAECDWDAVVSALAGRREPLPLLRSITPHGTRALSPDDALDLMVECDVLLVDSGSAVTWTLTRLKELTEAALSLPDSELRLVGAR